ncbi:hypothetical protein EB151_10635, partial [archaeon]|nr:hypothetical protein [archaeon]
MKKWIVAFTISIVTFLSAFKSEAQTYTQTYVDKCTNEIKIATTTFINGNAVVSFYNEVRTFSPFEVQSGATQVWIQATLLKYQQMSCPTNVVVQQTVQQAVQQAASQAASAAASQAASSAAS